MSNISYNSKKDKLFSSIASQIATSIKQVLRKKDLVTIALPGGRSSAEVCSALLDENIDWNQVHIFLVDERIVSLESDESNFNLIKTSFTDFLLEDKKISSDNLHPFQVDSSKSDFGAGAYSHELNELGGKFDIVVLSAGEDGHVASLFPNHHSIEDGANSYLVVEDSPKPPSGRISASRKLINKSDVAILMFIDDSKKQAFEDYNSVSKGVLSCPAKLVLNIPDTFVYTNIKI